MKLKFVLQKNAWFIEHDRAWYTLSDPAEQRLAASALPLVFIDEHELIEQPHLAGEARIALETGRIRSRFPGRARESGGVCVSLAEPDGTPVGEVRIPLDAGTLASIEWITPPFGDGWLDASASVMLDNVRRLELKVFVPGAADASRKRLIVHDENDGSATEFWLERDAPSVVPLLTNGGEGTVVLHLECEPEASGGADDARRLGFVLLDAVVEAA